MVTVLLAGCAASSVEPEKKDDEVVIATEKEEPVAEAGRYIICPNCGERIDL